MAEIDSSNPLGPVWPQRPIRKIEEGERAREDARRRERQKRKEADENSKDDDDGSPHIDEYA